MNKDKYFIESYFTAKADRKQFIGMALMVVTFILVLAWK